MFPSSWLSSLSTVSGFFPKGLEAVLNRVNVTGSVLKNGPARDAFLRDLSTRWSKYTQGVSSFNPTLFFERFIHPWLQPKGSAAHVQNTAGAGGLLAGLAMCVAGCSDTPIVCAPTPGGLCDPNDMPSSSVSPSSTESPTTSPDPSLSPTPTASVTPSPVTETDTPDTATETPEITPTPACFTGDPLTASIDCTASVILTPKHSLDNHWYLSDYFSASPAGLFVTTEYNYADNNLFSDSIYVIQSPIQPGTHQVAEIAKTTVTSNDWQLLEGELVDLNRDGYVDLVCTGLRKNVAEYTREFGLHVFFSAGYLASKVDTTQASSSIVLKSQNGSYDPSYVIPRAIGDFNGDGKSDFVVAASENDTPVYIFTKAIQNGIIYDVKADADTALTGDRSYLQAQNIAALGDVNGDGYSDFAISGPTSNSDPKVFNGKAMIVLGGVDLPKNGAIADYSTTLTLSDPTETSFNGNIRVGAARDVNGDGFSDLFIHYAPEETAYKGITYLVFGDPAFTNGTTYRVEDLVAQRKTWTLEMGGTVNTAYAVLPDMDQDDRTEILISNADNQGAVYAIQGENIINGADYSGMAWRQWTGTVHSRGGLALVSWDYDRDERPDVIVNVISRHGEIYMMPIPDPQ